MANTQPDITFRQAVSPFAVLTSITYVQSAPGGNNFPVLQGQNSDPVALRIYNNWAKNSGIANAINVQVTVYDGSSSASHTVAKSIAGQEWMRIFQTGYGENSITPGNYTQFIGVDTAIGGVSNAYRPEYGSDGGIGAQIRAGSAQGGIGFMEFQTYVQVPAAAATFTWNFSISVFYEWLP